MSTTAAPPGQTSSAVTATVAGGYVPAEAPNVLTLRDLLQILFRHRLRIEIWLALCLIASVVLTLATTRVYQSEASVLIKFGREFVYRPELGADANQVIAAQNDSEVILNTQVELLKSRDVIDRTIARVGLARLYPRLADRAGRGAEEAASRFASAFSATPLRTSNILQLSFRHTDPALAQETLDDLIQVFRDKSLDVYTSSQTRFFEDQLAAAQRRFTTASAALAAFRTKLGPLGYAQTLPLMLQSRADLAALAARADADLASAEARAAGLKTQIAQTPADVTAYTDSEQSRVLDDAKTKLLNLRLREQELLAQFTEDARPVRQLRKEIVIAETFLRQQSGQFAGTVRKARNETVVTLEQDLGRAQAEVLGLAMRRRQLGESIASLDRQIAEGSGHDGERWALEQAAETEQASVKQFAEKLTLARASDSLNADRVGNVSIVQAPSLPPRNQPLRPSALANLLVGLVAGVLGGIVIALLSELSSDTIYDPARAERALDLPMVAVFNQAA